MDYLVDPPGERESSPWAPLGLLKRWKEPLPLARGAAVLWAAWFSAYDAVAGIATGILIGGECAGWFR
jgi:hypothetical protein